MSQKLKLLCSLWFLVCASLSAALTDAWPQMVRADQSATITMVFENEPLLEKPERLALTYFNDDGLRSDGQPFQYGVKENIPFVIEGNTLKATLRFPGETIHTLTLVDANKGNETPVAVFKLYSLKPDFFALRPFKGNFHMHSQFSDGQEKTGSIMVATCRMYGQDFASESDHNAYAGSEEAMAFFHHVPTDMKAYPGEEVHSQGNSVHILSVGSRESMADWFRNNQPEYEACVKAELAKMGQPLPSQFMWMTAASHVIWDRIRSRGGMAVFCHPYWRPDSRQYIPKPVSDHFYNEMYCDVIEIVNGGSSEHSILQYHEQTAKGTVIPVLSSSDAHSAAGLIYSFNLVLSETVDIQDIIRNIKKCRSVAVQYIPKTNKYYAHGSERVARYAYFLLENFYPVRHDPWCKEEGGWLLTLAKQKAGDINDEAACATALENLKKVQGRVPALLEKYWQQ